MKAIPSFFLASHNLFALPAILFSASPRGGLAFLTRKVTCDVGLIDARLTAPRV